MLGILVAATKGPDVWPPTATLGLLLVAAMSVLLSTKLDLASDAIHYRSLFVGINVPLARVVAAKFVTGFRGYKFYQRLVITVRENTGEKEITINVGLFDLAQINQWVNALNARLS